VEGWAEENLLLLGTLSDQSGIRSKDFTDDRLEQALDYISKKENWLAVSNQLSARSLTVYDLKKSKTIRLDSAPMQGHHKIKAGGLFQHGYSKHHDPRLGMVKVMLACVDNEINGFGCPLAHLTVSGEQADDRLYSPLIKQCEAIFEEANYVGGKLYVGDSKMGSMENRHYIVSTGNDYLLPLTKVQLSAQQREASITQEREDNCYEMVYTKGASGEKELVAKGFKQEVRLGYVNEKGEAKEWIERRLFVLSTAYSLAQQKSLGNRLTKMEERLKDLVSSKQGKRVIASKEELEERVSVLLKEKKLSGLLSVKVEEVVETKKVRAYKERAAREEEIRKFRIEVSRNEAEIALYKSTLGWQVYATSTEKEAMNFEQCVWKYRYQNRVERQFDNLRNKIVPLVPIFLKQENRVEALINLLMICLKVCAVLEYKVAKQLHKNKEELTNVYEGNPKRGTATPTAKRILGSFKGISLVVNNSTPNISPPQIMITDLKEVQSKIIVLLGFQKDIYAGLIDKMQLFFLNKKISES